MTKKIRGIIFSASFFFSLFSQQAEGAEEFLRVGTGLFSYEVFKNTKSTNSSINKFGTGYVLPLQVEFPLEIWQQRFLPRLMYTLIPVQSPDRGSSSSILLASLPWIYTLNDRWQLSVGLGYLVRTIRGSGGSAVLDNGLGTSTFSFPGRTVSSKNFTSEFGVHLDRDQYIFGLNSVITGTLTKKRALSLSFSMGIRI